MRAYRARCKATDSRLDRVVAVKVLPEQDGVDYLVMEYIEGETLQARLERGPLSLDETLRYSIEISDALDKAHRSASAAALS